MKNTREFTVKLRGPADLSTAEIAKALEMLGVEVIAVPQHGTGKRSGFNCHARAIGTVAKVLPFARGVPA